MNNKYLKNSTLLRPDLDVQKLENSINIGYIQIVYNPEELCLDNSVEFRKNTEQEIIFQIETGFTKLKESNKDIQIIVLPELCIPLGYINRLRNLALSSKSVVIGGLIYLKQANNLVSNKGIIIVPSRWPDRDIISKYSGYYFFGKTFPSQIEKKSLESKNLQFKSESNIYVIDSGEYGMIGIAICADFYDIERLMLYKGRIHHLIIIALNQDTNSFHYLAQAISRLTFCNVIICNNGYYGDSLAFSPYKEDYKRFVYRHKGKQLFSTQIVELPVHNLDLAQHGKELKNEEIFKSKPPGYKKYK